MAVAWEEAGCPDTVFPAKSNQSFVYSDALRDSFRGLNERCMSRLRQYENIWPSASASADGGGSSGAA
eukprot:44553-Amphidinium_carterae.1